MIYIGLGSNLGVREDNIKNAIHELKAHAAVRLVKSSSLYQTEPFGYKEQPKFLNAVIEIETSLQPIELLELCLSIEKKLGRVRDLHWGPRVIDLDILLFNEVEIKSDQLVLPHPGLVQRRFVLVPLAEIAASTIIYQNKTANELLAELEDNSQIEPYTASREARVLFISAPFGSGHMRAAQAVCTALKEIDAGVKVEILNVFDFMNPVLGQLIIKIYLKILQWIPGLYGGMYGWGHSSKLALLTREIISRFFAKRMVKHIKKYQPTCIVCTHATPAGLIEYLSKNNCIDIPTMAIITDFVVHRWWVYPMINEYFVANQDMRDYLANSGIGQERSYLSGIPVHSDFLETPDVASIYEKLKLDPNISTVLIMGGGAGVLPMDKILTECDQLETPLQFVVVTGDNKVMFKKLLALQKGLRHTVRVLGYIDYVDQLMHLSKVLISKPGGMTSAECLCRGLPLIMFSPIPGQEEANTNYLVQHQLALRADTVAQVKATLLDTLTNDNITKQIKKNMIKLAKPYSAQMIAKHILAKHKDVDRIV